MTGRKVYLILQTVVCILLVIMLSGSAVKICREGTVRKAEDPMESIYTPKIAAEAFAPVMPLAIAALGLLAAGLALNIKDEKAEKPVKDPRISRDLTAARIKHPSEAMNRERSLQKKLLTAGWCGFALCMIPVIIYLADSGHFPEQDPESMFYGLLRVLVPWTALALGVLAVTGVLREKSFLRETEAARIRLKEERKNKTEKTPAGTEGIRPVSRGESRQQKQGTVRAAVVVAAAALIIMGVLNGSAHDVLVKAVTICTECIGLG